MKNLIISFFIISLISCDKEKKEQFFFSQNLYTEILKYQQENPIPNNKLNSLSIYDISFSKNQDTLITITISPQGIQYKNCFGIYESNILKPTYVIDSQKLGRKFIKIYKKDSIDNYILKGTPPHSDVIYPFYKYKVQGDKLILIDSLR
ncbi:hypothetical protein [Chryseobacterium luteum]|uniref:Lipoprotein n=1 Tax=Chryseobacterium luteum TaxID=421531 RepID=A0A085ZBK1_9FLAO|nr:hypothetical protein [Chryseobacterium luteum]KFF01815.1 hypothetical protein IX38_15035 [Chryseobacterium luteum]